MLSKTAALIEDLSPRLQERLHDGVPELESTRVRVLLEKSWRDEDGVGRELDVAGTGTDRRGGLGLEETNLGVAGGLESAVNQGHAPTVQLRLQVGAGGRGDGRDGGGSRGSRENILGKLLNLNVTITDGTIGQG